MNQLKPRLAKLISRVFEPIIEIPLLITISTMVAYLNGYRWRFLAFLLVVDAVIPRLYFLYLLRSKRAQDWDITVREQRLPLFWLSVATHFMGVILAFWLNRQPLANILLSFWFLAVIFTIITQVYKISLHTGVNTTLVIFSLYLFGSRVWWLLALPVIVSWARIVYRKHTLAQVVFGGLVPAIILPLSFYLLGVKF